jgi:hypothetical protein
MHEITLLLVGALATEKPDVRAAKGKVDFIRVGKDRRHFVLSRSGSEFTPWGFNYDHDAANRLLEDYAAGNPASRLRMERVGHRNLDSLAASR